jgi:hypothetical protein
LKDNATEYERAVFRALSALVGEERDVEVAIERHFQVRPRPNLETELSAHWILLLPKPIEID